MIDQIVEADSSITEPTNAAGESFMSDIMYYYDGGYYYRDYEFIGFYYEPTYDTEYNGEGITANTTLYAKWRDYYEDFEQIPEVNLTITAPKVGTEVTMEGEDWDTQRPQINTTVPESVHYHLDGRKWLQFDG